MIGQWRAGDVAMVRWTDSGSETAAIVESVESATLVSVWTYTGDVRGPLAFHPRDLRPLVVLDPKDHPNLPALLEIAANASAMRGRAAAALATGSLAAEIAPAYEPDRPEEPKGLGAVVEDDDGEQWVRSHTASRHPWTRPHLSGKYPYAQINTVRVLNHGVPS